MSKSRLIKKTCFVFLGVSCLIPFARSQNGEHVNGGHFLKRVEYNMIMLYDLYNLESKGEEEKLLFGKFNAPVEFAYLPSFEGASGFRVVKDSLGASVLEIKYISNYDEAIKIAYRMAAKSKIDLPAEVLNSLPREVFNLIYDYNNHRIVEKNPEKLPSPYKVETLSFPISERFAEKLHQKMVLFIDGFKAKGVPQLIMDGHSVTFRTVVDDEVWSLRIHVPRGNALKMADFCRQIITDAKANTFEESKYAVD